MKKVLSITVISITTFLLSSCVSTNKGFQSSPVISRVVQLDPIKADIVVNEKEKLKGESTSSYFLIFRVSGDRAIADGITYSTDASTAASSSILQALNPISMFNRAKGAGRLNKVRGAAAYKALNESGDYDVLVHPIYATTVENYWIVKKYSVKVEGYGGKYTNFRTEKQKIVVLDSNGKEYILQDRQ